MNNLVILIIAIFTSLSAYAAKDKAKSFGNIWRCGAYCKIKVDFSIGSGFSKFIRADGKDIFEAWQSLNEQCQAERYRHDFDGNGYTIRLASNDIDSEGPASMNGSCVQVNAE